MKLAPQSRDILRQYKALINARRRDAGQRELTTAQVMDEILSGNATPAQIAGIIMALATKGEQKADPTHGPVIPQEWDVWLDKEHPGDLTKVKIAHGNTPTTVLQGAQKDKVVGYNRDDVKHAKNGAEWMELFGKSIAMFRGGVSDQAAADAQPEGKHEAMMKALAATTAEEAMATCAQFLNKQNGGGGNFPGSIVNSFTHQLVSTDAFNSHELCVSSRYQKGNKRKTGCRRR